MGSAGPSLHEAAVDHALICAARRMSAHDDERAVLVHGDILQLNAFQVLVVPRSSSSNPTGLLAEAKRDLGMQSPRGDSKCTAFEACHRSRSVANWRHSETE